MYRLESVYGLDSFQAWTTSAGRLDDLSSTREEPGAQKMRWPIHSYPELVRTASFLSVMNKRLVLHFRGQSGDHPLLPSLLRETWTTANGAAVPLTDRRHYFRQLAIAGTAAHRACERFGLPRWRTIERVPEAQWSIVQHYELWPTPFLDVTRSLRVAASFAFGWGRPKPATGHLYVLGLPPVHDSISVSFDDQLMMIRLDSVCPPSAERPHFQEGVLVSRFPFAMRELMPENRDRNDARRRLIAHFTLEDDGSFWSDDFPQISKEALLPEGDELLRWFRDTTRIDHARDGLAWFA